MTTETTKRPPLAETAAPRHDLDPIDAMGWLHDADTGEALRPASRAEREASIAATARDGGAGVILVDNDGNLVDVGGWGADEARRVYVADVAPAGVQAGHPAERAAVEVIDSALGALKQIAYQVEAVNLPGVHDQVDRAADEIGLPRGDEDGAEEVRLAWWDRIGLSRLYDVCEFIRSCLRDGRPTSRDEEITARVRAFLDEGPAGPDLAARVETLEARLDELVESFAGEVRTRRLAVVDDQGAERITSFINETETELVVGCPAATDLQATLTVSGFPEGAVAGVGVRDLEEDLAILGGEVLRSSIDGEPVEDPRASGSLVLSDGSARSTSVNRSRRVLSFRGSTIHTPDDKKSRSR